MTFLAQPAFAQGSLPAEVSSPEVGLLAVNREDLLDSPSVSYKSQTVQQRANVIELSGTLSRDGGHWKITSDQHAYVIHNPESWTPEDWFEEGSTVQLFGNRRTDLHDAGQTPVVMASHIFQVKVSPVKNVQDRIEQEIRDQATKENVQKYGHRVPFIKRWLNKVGW